jgi:hypothetical protein
MNFDLPNTSSSGVFSAVCLFCENVTKYQGRGKREYLGSCETEIASKSIFDAAIILDDDNVLSKIAGIDMIAKEVKHHHSCRRAYMNRAKKGSNESCQSRVTSHDRAFSQLRAHIVNNLIHSEGAELLTSLHSKYISYMDDEHSTYPASSLRDKIITEFPTQIKQFKLSNKQGIVMCNSNLAEDTAIKRALFDHNSIIEAAFHLRSLIKGIERTQKNLPDQLTADILSKGQGEPPEDLLTFFRVLYTGSTVVSDNEKVSRLVSSVCADVMFATSRGRIKPGKHLTMGLGMKSITGTRKVLEILNRFGHSISYHVTEEIETSLATEIADKQVAIPDGLLQKAGLATALAWDNYDENTETLSGMGTVHDTVGICYQNIQPLASDVDNKEPYKTNKEAQTIKTGKKQTPKRVFCREQRNLEPYWKKPKVSTFEYQHRTIDRPLHVTDMERRDMFWMISMALGPTPMWTGWNAQLTEDILPQQHVAYMENISLPPTRMDVVVETMKISQQVAKECGEDYAVVTYDLAIAKPAMQIQANEAPLYNNIFICFGAFHICLAYFGCLGYFLDGSGGPNILTETDVLAPGSLNGFLLGKHYNRCKRLHPLLATAVQSLHFSAFLREFGKIPDIVLAALADIEKEPSPAIIHNLEETDQYITFMTAYEIYTEQTLEGQHGSTAQYWMVYVKLVNQFLLFTRACRTNDLTLFIYALEQMIPVFFAGNRPNYARWMIRYHLNLLNAESTHPGVTQMLQDGALSVRRTPKSFSRTAVDMTLEQTVNADAASRLTGIGSFTQSQNARRRWMVTRSVRSSIVGSLLNLAGIASSEDITKDLKPHRIQKDHDDLLRLANGIQSTMNPFTQDVDANLYCLTSGQKLSDPIKDELLCYIAKGEAWANEFREACFVDPSRYEKPIPRRKVKNFASAAVKTKVQTKQKVQEVTGTRDLFGRLLLISTMAKIDLKKVFEFPLTPVPLSLSHTDGSLNTTDKSKLMHKLESMQTDHAVPERADVIIVDATFLLHTQQNVPLAFGGIARIILQQLCQMAEQVHLVCDTYVSPSIKDAERQRRGTREIVFNITGPDQNRPKDWQAALKSSSFKTSLFRFLATEWMHDRYADVLVGHKVYLALDNNCFCFTSNVRTTIPALTSYHEEADTRMVFHLHSIIQEAEVANITIRSNDTDVLVILLYYLSRQDTNIRIWLDAGLSSNNTRRHISINDLVTTIDSGVLKALPGLHAFTGCDYTASFLNKGKIKPLELMMKNDEFKTFFAELGACEVLSDEIIRNCERFVCHLYGKSKLVHVNDARHVIFQQAYAPQALDDPMISIKGVHYPHVLKF